MYVALKYISRLVDKRSANTMNMNIYVKYPKVYSNLNSKQWSIDFPNRAKQIKTAENYATRLDEKLSCVRILSTQFQFLAIAVISLFRVIEEKVIHEIAQECITVGW